jgi:hypothetical protein
MGNSELRVNCARATAATSSKMPPSHDEGIERKCGRLVAGLGMGDGSRLSRHRVRVFDAPSRELIPQDDQRLRCLDHELDVTAFLGHVHNNLLANLEPDGTGLSPTSMGGDYLDVYVVSNRQALAGSPS